MLETIPHYILPALYHLLKNILYEATNIVSGENSFKSNFNNTHIKMHAEIDALKKIKKLYFSKKLKKKEVDLVSICIKRGKIHNGLPCKHCILQLIKSGVNINNVYYSTSNSIECIKFAKLVKSNTYTSSGWKNINA